MDYPLLSLTITVVTSLLVAAYIFFRDYHSLVSKSYLTLIGSFTLWALSQALLYVSQEKSVVLFADKLTYLFGLCIVWSFLNFVRVFPYTAKDTHLFLRYMNYTFTLISLYVIFSPQFVDYHGVNGAFTSKPLYLHLQYFSFYVFTFFSILFHACILLFDKYRTSSGNIRFQLKILIFSSSIPIIVGSIVNLILFYFDAFHLQVYGPSFTLFFTLTIAYTIFIRPRFER